MRTKHLLMAIATLLVAGCSQNEITEVRTVGNPAVGFDVYTGVATRGTDVSTTTMQGTCDERPIMAVSALWDITQGVKIGMRLKEP